MYATVHYFASCVFRNKMLDYTLSRAILSEMKPLAIDLFCEKL